MTNSGESRRWTISGLKFVGTGSNRTGVLPNIEPALEVNEVVEVMPVAEYEALNREAVRLHAAAWRVYDAAGQGEAALADALVALGLELAGESPQTPNPQHSRKRKDER